MARCIKAITTALIITGVKAAAIIIVGVLQEEKNKGHKVDMLIIWFVIGTSSHQ